MSHAVMKQNPLCSQYAAMVVEGIHGENILDFFSSFLSLIISWTFRILAHEKDQYTDFLAIALKQTKAGASFSSYYYSTTE